MATDIKITPTIKGEDSKQFNAVISKSRENKISATKKKSMVDLVEKVLAKTQKEKTNIKLITEPAFLPNTCYVLGGL